MRKDTLCVEFRVGLVMKISWMEVELRRCVVFNFPGGLWYICQRKRKTQMDIRKPTQHTRSWHPSIYSVLLCYYWTLTASQQNQCPRLIYLGDIGCCWPMQACAESGPRALDGRVQIRISLMGNTTSHQQLGQYGV